MPPRQPRTFLGFDFGMKRIGVATGQDLTFTTTSLEVLPATDGKPDWDVVSRLIDTWRPDALIVGIPLSMDGSENDMTHAARRFGNRLRERYHLPVHMIDERLSSREAEQHLATPGKRRPRTGNERVDAVAARVILQTWMAEQQTKTLATKGTEQ